MSVHFHSTSIVLRHSVTMTPKSLLNITLGFRQTDRQTDRQTQSAITRSHSTELTEVSSSIIACDIFYDYNITLCISHAGETWSGCLYVGPKPACKNTEKNLRVLNKNGYDFVELYQAD